jgi:type I restriction enzyme S subunit
MTFSGPIGGLIDFAIGGGWGSEAPKDGHSRVAVIRGTDIPKVAAGDFSTVPFRFESDKKIVNRVLSPGDVVLETAGGSSANGQYTGRTLLITQEILDSLGPTICASFCKKLVLKKDLVNSTYFYFYMQDLYNSGRVASYDSQSTGISNFQYEAFVNNEILELPPKEVQLSIGVALQNLNRKINVNSQISKTIEELAQTIFKSWFIDFDPVRGKLAGNRPLGVGEDTASLFPNSLVDSDLGAIPKGWEARTIGSLCETRLGGTPSRARQDFWGGDIPWINSGKVNEFRITSPSEFITEGGLEKSATKLLPKGTTVLAITGATLGQFSRLEIDACANQSVVGIIGSEEASNEFIYLSIMNNINRLISVQTGGAQQHINKEDINAFSINYPGQELMRTFTDICGPLFSKIGTLALENVSLAQVRDSLLPRLISGELEVPEESLAS